MIVIGEATSVRPGATWAKWPVDDDRAVLTHFNNTGSAFIFTNGPGRETKLALSHEATAVLFSALYYEIVGKPFDPTTIGATP